MASEERQVVRRRLRVTGAVQGVGFRAGCARAAEASGVVGWVRNRADGSVEAVVEGDLGAVDRVVAWCRAGPRGGRVDHVEVVAEDPTGEAGFTIRG